MSSNMQASAPEFIPAAVKARVEKEVKETTSTGFTSRPLRPQPQPDAVFVFDEDVKTMKERKVKKSLHGSGKTSRQRSRKYLTDSNSSLASEAANPEPSEEKENSYQSLPPSKLQPTQCWDLQWVRFPNTNRTSDALASVDSFPLLAILNTSLPSTDSLSYDPPSISSDQFLTIYSSAVPWDMACPSLSRTSTSTTGTSRSTALLTPLPKLNPLPIFALSTPALTLASAKPQVNDGNNIGDQCAQAQAAIDSILDDVLSKRDFAQLHIDSVLAKYELRKEEGRRRLLETLVADDADAKTCSNASGLTTESNVQVPELDDLQACLSTGVSAN